MRSVPSIYAFVAFGLVVACESGGADPGSASGSSSSSASSSSGSSTSSSSSTSSTSSSSGEAQCGATCQSRTTLTFEEANADGRLDGAFVEACFRDRCAEGTLAKADAGSTYSLPLTPSVDGGLAQVYASVTPGTTAGSLRFGIDWSLDYSGPYAPADGDTYTVNARASAGGAELFTRTFTATYRTVTVCGTVCKEYDGQ